jgi:hypothetical protein
VVGHLEDVRAQQRPGAEQVGLLGQLRVAGQQDRASGRGRPHHDRSVVHLGAVVRVDEGGRMRRPQHIEGETGPGQPLARGQRDQWHARRRGLSRDIAQRPPGLVDRTDADPAHGPPVQCARQPADVVGVEVAEEHEGDAAHPQPAEARVDRPDLRARVDQHHPARPPRGEHDRVALPDVAGDDQPTRGRPTRRDEPRRDHHERDPGERSDHHRTTSPRAADQDGGHQRRGHQQRTDRAGRPRHSSARHRRGVVGHGDEPRRGPSGQPHTRAGHRRRQRGEQSREHPQNGGGRDGRLSQQVGHDRDGADQPAQPGHERRRHEERGRRDGERLGHPPRHPAPTQPVDPRRREQHQGRRGRHRQSEPGVHGECWVGEQEHEHGNGERRQR